MDDEILQEFLAESWENLARLDSEIVVLEKQPQNSELLASIFRTIHTLKGTCGFIGLTGLGSVAHAAENVLGQMRNGDLDVNPQAISVVLQAVDQIKELLHGLEDSGSEPERDNSELIRQLDAIAEAGTAPEPKPAAVEFHVPAAAAPAETSLVANGAVSPDQGANPIGPALEIEHDVPNDGDSEAVRGQESGKKSIADLSIRVHVNVLDSLMNLVGELVLTRNQLLQMVRGEDESKYAAPITHLNRVTTDLQEGVMKTRMQPIGNAWSKLPRLVRDLAQQTGKQIELQMIGAETELDRTVLDAIKDPLTHMVRNSADHGLESAAIRRQRKKPEVGTVKLHAFHEGGHVIICIDDDGAGIALDKVRAKAIKNGLASEANAARLTDKELLQFVFQPGFSTAESITAVSGRGVGMDVVKTQIERIGGTVDLSTKAGVGTSVRIKIPLTLAIISALVVESGGLSFAIPQLGVVELVRLAAEDKHKIERINRNQVFRLRDRLLPLIHLHEALGLPDSRSGEDLDINIVVIQVGDDQFGLTVSEVFDTEEIVVKPVGSLLKDIEIYQGTTILGDGRVIMILDVAGIAGQFGGHVSETNEREQERADQDGDGEGELTSLLLFEAGADGRLSVPLSLVARLEEFPRSEIESTGGRKVVQYRGDLLPLLPIEGHAGTAPDPQPVIVFSEGNQSMGLMVDRIQDIIEERLVIRIPSRRPGVLGAAIVNGRATDILDIQHYVNQANPNWFQRKTEQRRRRVLAVDDSIFFRQLITTTLESAGHRVTAATSAIHAVEMLEHGQRFDLIVSDIDMPMMDGYEFAQWFRERQVDRQVPMIALTSNAGPRHVALANQAGFNRHLVKFDAAEFLAAVAELFIHQDLETLTGVGA
jgi:two-component system chemotaxis sensor kinase CheA